MIISNDHGLVRIPILQRDRNPFSVFLDTATITEKPEMSWSMHPIEQGALRMAADQWMIITGHCPVVLYCFCWKDMLLFSIFFRTVDADREVGDDRDEEKS